MRKCICIMFACTCIIKCIYPIIILFIYTSRPMHYEYKIILFKLIIIAWNFCHFCVLIFILHNYFTLTFHIINSKSWVQNQLLLYNIAYQSSTNLYLYWTLWVTILLRGIYSPLWSSSKALSSASFLTTIIASKFLLSFFTIFTRYYIEIILRKNCEVTNL